MKRNTQIKKFRLIAGIFLLVLGFTSCSDDDEDVLGELPTGMIQVEDFHNLTGNILTVPGVTVGQDSWLVAVELGDEATNNFIADPVMMEKGTSSNVQLFLNETAIHYIAGSQQIVLKLYADNKNGGIQGEWDPSDKPITLSNNVLILKTVTIAADLSNFDPFAYFDTNKNGSLDVEEVSETYSVESIYSNSSAITNFKFYSVMFHSTDTDYYDSGITQAEWSQGYLRMFSNWAQDNFSVYDLNKNSFLDLDEWSEIFNESEWFEGYDTNSDKMLTKEELNKGLFGDWDLNNDGEINEEEFVNYWRKFSFSDGVRPM
ncbi:MAG: EF-hand domain-containing protein [Gillisia sp.]